MKISELEINEIKEKFDSERKYKVYEFEDKVIISKDELRFTVEDIAKDLSKVINKEISKVGYYDTSRLYSSVKIYLESEINDLENLKREETMVQFGEKNEIISSTENSIDEKIKEIMEYIKRKSLTATFCNEVDGYYYFKDKIKFKTVEELKKYYEEKKDHTFEKREISEEKKINKSSKETKMIFTIGTIIIILLILKVWFK